MALLIPTPESFVEIHLKDLPEDPQTIINVLVQEIAPMECWYAVVQAYMHAGDPVKVQGLVRIIVDLLQSPDAKEAYGEAVVVSAQVQFLCGYAHYLLCLIKSHQNMSEAERTNALVEAHARAKSAEELDQKDQLPKVTLALWHLAKNELERAEKLLRQAVPLKCRGEMSVLALVALAGVQFRMERHKAALQSYAKVLERCPQCPVDVRTMLGVCHVKLGDFNAARACFLRALELDPRSLDATLGIAVLDMNSGDPRARSRALEALVQAFAVEPAHPGLLSVLAGEALGMEDFERAGALADAAASMFEQAAAGGSREAQSFLAEATCVGGRARHAMGDFTNAALLYQKASSLPGLPRRPLLALLGMSQMFLRQSHVRDAATNAVGALEQVLAQAPLDADVLEMLAPLYHRNPLLIPKLASHVAGQSLAKARTVKSLEVVAELLASTDLRAAAAALDAATERARAQEATQGPYPGMHKLLNNAAVVRARLGESTRAAALLDQAIEVAARADPPVPAGAHFLLGFNRAVLHELAGELAPAADTYRRMISEFPAYADAYVRLAGVEHRTRGAAAASEVLARGLAVDALATDASLLCSEARMLEELRDYAGAEALLKRAADALPRGRDDPYVQVLRGNLSLHAVPTVRDKADEERVDKLVGVAAGHYARALKNDPNNVFAASGLAAAMALSGEFQEAQAALAQVTEAVAVEGTAPAPQAVLNAGACSLALDDLQAAVKTLDTAARRNMNGLDVRSILFLGRALYDSERMEEAKRLMAAAVHLHPHNHVLQFNAAMCMQKSATSRLDRMRKLKAFTPVEAAAADQATEDLARALKLFIGLQDIAQVNKHVQKDLKHLKSHIDFCSDAVSKALKYREQAQAAMRDLDTQRARMECERMALEAQRKLDVMLEQKAAEAKRARVDERLREMQRKQEALTEQLRMGDGGGAGKDGAGEEKERERTKGRKRKGSAVEDGEERGGSAMERDVGSEAGAEGGEGRGDEGGEGTGAGGGGGEAGEGGDLADVDDEELMRQAGLLDDDDEDMDQGAAAVGSQGDADGGGDRAGEEGGEVQAGEGVAKRRRVLDDDE